MSSEEAIHHSVQIGTFHSTQSSTSVSAHDNKGAKIHDQDLFREEGLEVPEIPYPSNWFKRFLYDYNAEMGEFFAMFVFVFVGCCITSQAIFRMPHSEGSMDMTICFGWGCALVLAVAIGAGTSGAHLNPAITVGKAVFGHYPWKRVPSMVFAQTFGSFVGAMFTWLYYYPMWELVNPGHRQSVGTAPTAEIFVIQPSKKGIYTNANLFFNEAVMTFCMLFAVHFVADKRMTASATTAPVLLGLMLTAILLAGSQISAIGINSARDFGPRLFILMAGWHDTFSVYNYYFYVPLISPIVGGIAAQGLYDYLMVPEIAKGKFKRQH